MMTTTTTTKQEKKNDTTEGIFFRMNPEKKKHLLASLEYRNQDKNDWLESVAGALVEKCPDEAEEKQ